MPACTVPVVSALDTPSRSAVQCIAYVCLKQSPATKSICLNPASEHDIMGTKEIRYYMGVPFLHNNKSLNNR